MKHALKIIFLFTLSTILINCSSKNQPQEYDSHASYDKVYSYLGCGSGYDSPDITFYTNYFMTWPGKVTAAKGGSAYLDLDGKSLPDLKVTFLHGHAGDKLSKGEIVLVRFKFKYIGNCISPVMGEEATLEPRFLSLAWWKFFLSK